MNWNKLRKQLEEFINPTLEGRVEYLASGYRYRKDKKTQALIKVDKEEVFNMHKTFVTWYENEQAIIKDENFKVFVTEEDIIETRKSVGDNVPEDRLEVIARKNKRAFYAKKIMNAQNSLLKTDFQKAANDFLSGNVNDCLNSDDIILNVLAIIDRRVGKNRLKKMKYQMDLKHPIVRYFYDLRS
ncbi:hypothetical protein EZV73_18190 [Acidaminobacter sp. JC074]|uniref:SF0329 family protein n=1 Tax=Acidaminobacter sp. JC074 TaxID=2530199 RepID=UPI001F0D8290|nr:hypothetical protein [Acidaminobacter sp. JC074]MCH4889517.1 hypothetical protein [Acidaminobacter sp. JC074]